MKRTKNNGNKQATERKNTHQMKQVNRSRVVVGLLLCVQGCCGSVVVQVRSHLAYVEAL